MAAAEPTPGAGQADGAAARRHLWLGATVALTVGAVVLALVLAPDGGRDPVPALVWLLFVGSSLHVGASGWFVTVPEVRRHMRAHPNRYVRVPAALVAVWAALAVVCDERRLAWCLLAFFAWQFHHFQKQNLGVAALAAAAYGVRPLSTTERRALVVAGAGGIAALLGHPALLQVAGVGPRDWLFATGGVVCAAAVVTGMVCLARRPAGDRPVQYAGAYAVSLLFFVPVFCWSSPYAAVAGLTIAHGLQYLLLMALVAGARTPGAARGVGVLVLLNVALALGVVLNWSSHRHGGGPVERAVFGAYLGLVSAHFVVDAGLWRLRDGFPRSFLGPRLPFLLPQRRDAVRTDS